MSTSATTGDALSPARILPWIPLLVLLAAAVLVDLGIATFLRVDGEKVAGLTIGVMFAQVVASAVWSALGPTRLAMRLLTATAALGLACVAMFLCAMRDAGDDAVAFSLSGAMVVQWLLYQAPLWMVRRRGWRLAWPNTEPGGSPSQGEMQFGLRHLLLWTTFVAGFLAIVRFALAGRSIEFDNQMLDGYIAVFIVLSLFNTLLVFPIVWGCFVRRRVWLWLIISVVWWALLTPLELYVLDQAMGGDMEFFLLLNIAQACAVTIVLLCARLAGFRLTRQHAG